MNKYGLSWPENYTSLNIEIDMIRHGGYIERASRKFGCGKYFHYRTMMDLLWPEDDHHRWSDLCLKRKTENEILVLMGSSDSNKTWFSSKYVLCSWWADPYKRLWLVSTTEARGSELRNWGAIKRLFNRARIHWPWLKGVVLESKSCITPDTISDGGREGRLLTHGIIFVPCKNASGDWVGLGPLAGIKPPKDGLLGHFADELSFMHPNFLNAYANWYGKNFEGILDGNPTDLDDPLCRAAKPNGGWEGWTDTKKTQEWRSEFYDAWVIALDGRDSPNDDYPREQPLRFPYLISHKKREAVAKLHGEESPLYMSQCVGKPVPGLEKFRVIPHMLPERTGAYEPVVWEGSDLTDVVSLDAAYGGEGGDRCILNHLRFGKDVNNHDVIANKPSITVPISLQLIDRPEIQIAKFCRNYCEPLKIPPTQFFFDGRSTLAMALAEVWSSQVNVVDFGGPATSRPVSQDEFIFDEDLQEKRLKRCDEHYSRFVTELWFSVYYLMISRQLRELTKDIAMELRRRVWKKVAGDRIQVETKKEMKLRLNESPDLADAFVIGVEGARRLGFVIATLKEKGVESGDDNDWLERELEEHRRKMRRLELKPR